MAEVLGLYEGEFNTDSGVQARHRPHSDADIRAPASAKSATMRLTAPLIFRWSHVEPCLTVSGVEAPVLSWKDTWKPSSLVAIYIFGPEGTNELPELQDVLMTYLGWV